MSHNIYENEVLANKVESLLATQIDMNAYMTADYSLSEAAGMKKVVNVYTASGDVEDLAMGVGNSESIEVSFDPHEYVVGVTQGRTIYYDEQEMTDPMVVEVGVKGLTEQMTNDLTTKAINAMKEATLQAPITAWDFDNVVDAIAKYPYEDEAGLFLLINPAQKAAFRKNLADDLKYVEGFARTGYIGSVCSVPVIVSKAVPEGFAFLGSKDAVTCFVKKGSEIEQERDANTRKNTIYARKVMLIALTDARKMIILGTAQATAATITTKTAGAKTIAGAATTGASVQAYVNGEATGSAVTAASNAYTITATNNLVAGDVIKVVAKVDGKLDSIVTATV